MIITFENMRFSLGAGILALILLMSSTGLSQSNRAERKFQRAREAVRDNDYEDALKHLHKAIEDSPKYMEARLFLADLYQKMEKPDSAAAVYVRAEEYGLPYYAWYKYGKMLLATARYEKAEKVLQRYAQHPKARSRYAGEVQRWIKSAQFAQEAKKDPVPYDPENLGKAVNTDQMEYFPSISANGTMLVFTHRKMQGAQQELDEDFWYTRRDSVGAEWQEARRLPGKLNSPGNEGAQTITADGEVIFFAACKRPNGYGSCDIFASFRQPDDSWGKARNLGKAINSKLWESQPSISPDGQTLYFVRGKSSYDKELNIYYSRFTKNGWTQARPVPGKVNTSGQETSPFIHFDDQHLYFSSNGHPGMGDLDFFVSTRQADGSWGDPHNLGYPINTPAQEFSLIVAPDGETGYFSSNALESTLGMLDLYSFELPEESRSEAIAYLKGRVVNKKNQEPLQAMISFINLQDSARQFVKSSTRQGKFYAVLPVEEEYALSIAKKGFLFYSRHFQLQEKNQEKAREMRVELIPIEKDQQVKLENVFFEFDSYKLQKRSYPELDKVVEFLEANPGVMARLEGHTDNQGNDSYNKTLSENRAKTVYQYLVDQGIDARRLGYRGYGADQPIASNETEKGRAQNRRTEMIITEYQ